MDKEIALPIRNDTVYIHENNDKKIKFDYIYMFEGFKLIKLWKANIPVNTFILPRIDYSQENDDLYGFDLKLAKELITDDKDFGEDLIKRYIEDSREKVFELLCRGRIAIQDKSIENINNIDYNLRREFKTKPANVIVTGNSSVSFTDISFDYYANVNFILPKGMNLYKVHYRANGLVDYHKKDWYLISSKIIQQYQEKFKNKYLGYFVEKIDSIKTDMLHAEVDKNYVYDRKTNRIVDRTQSYELNKED